MTPISHIKHKKLAMFSAGIIASFGFPPIYALPVFIMAMIFAFLLCDDAKSCKKVASLGYCFGIGFFCAGFYWISNALLVDISSFGFLYPITLLAPGIFFGLFLIPPFLAWHYFRNSGIWYKIIGFSALFVCMEYIRSFFLTGFPWNMLGSMFAFSNILIQTASLIGTYGLSFLVLIITGACYALLKKDYMRAVTVLLAVSVFMSSFGIWRIKTQNNDLSSLKIRLVQPSIPQTLKWDERELEQNLKTYIEMSRKNISKDVKMVVWGETAVAFNPQDSAYYRRLLKQAVPQEGYLVTGTLRYNKKHHKLYNSLSVIDEKGKTVAFYDKNHLVPFGEYIPFRRYLPQWIKPVANQIADLSEGEPYKRLHVQNLPDFSALICYEIIFPDKVVNRKDKPNFLVVVSNDGWYGQSFGPYQHLVAARLRAVEEGITIIRSANNGISAVINPAGIILGQIPLNIADIKDIYLPKVLTLPTVYARIGGTLFQLGMVLLCFLAWLKKKIDTKNIKK